MIGFCTIATEQEAGRQESNGPTMEQKGRTNKRGNQIIDAINTYSTYNAVESKRARIVAFHLCQLNWIEVCLPSFQLGLIRSALVQENAT